MWWYTLSPEPAPPEAGLYPIPLAGLWDMALWLLLSNDPQSTRDPSEHPALELPAAGLNSVFLQLLSQGVCTSTALVGSRISDKISDSVFLLSDSGLPSSTVQFILLGWNRSPLPHLTLAKLFPRGLNPALILPLSLSPDVLQQ